MFMCNKQEWVQIHYELQLKWIWLKLQLHCPNVKFGIKKMKVQVLYCIEYVILLMIARMNYCYSYPVLVVKKEQQ